MADTRYQYAGQHGYESIDSLAFQHVGYRWYDAATGRFLQRDPDGIWGGLNTYVYVGDNPVIHTDPSGLGLLDWIKRALAALKKYFQGGRPAPNLLGPADILTRSLSCAPDVARIAIGVGHRRNSINLNNDAEHILRDYERGHNRFVQPGRMSGWN